MTTRPARLLICLLLLSGLARGRQDEAPVSIRNGPMVGHATETTCALWVQTDGPAEVRFRYRDEAEAEGPWTLSPPATTSAEDAFTATVVITGLPHGRRFVFEPVLNGKPVRRPYPMRFRTLPHWLFRSDPPELKVVFGSCAYVNDATVDRPGRPYGGDPTIFGAVAAQEPDLMLWLGDNCYFRAPDWSSRSGMLHRYGYARELPELQPLLAAAHHYAIWDDHDFGPNDSDWTFPGRRDALSAFQRFWANPSHGLEGVPGCFTRFVWGDVEFFLLDDRYHRTPNRAPRDDPDRTMFGQRQLRWLFDSLSSSSARFKVVAGGNQMLNPVADYEGLANFPKDRERLLEEVRRRDLRGLIFLSGDRHHAELIRIEGGAGYALHEFTSSPLMAGLHDAAGERDNPARVPGTLVTDRRNFGMLVFSGALRKRQVLLECRDAEGARIWSRSLSDEDLGWRRR